MHHTAILEVFLTIDRRTDSLIQTDFGKVVKIYWLQFLDIPHITDPITSNFNT
jgi:hypothetical protein